MYMHTQMWQGSLDARSGGAKNMLVSGADKLYTDLQSRLDYLLMPERTSSLILRNMYYNPPGACVRACACFPTLQTP